MDEEQRAIGEDAMNRWIDEKSNLRRSTSKLTVPIPKAIESKSGSPSSSKSNSQSVLAQNEKQNLETISPGGQGAPTSDSDVTTTLLDQFADTNSLPFSDDPFGSDPFDIDGFVGFADSSHGLALNRRHEPDKRWFNDFAFFYGIPSWLVSFVFHLILIIALALFSFSTKDGKNIELVMDASSTSNEMELMEVAVEMSPVELDQDDLRQAPEAVDLSDDFSEMVDSETHTPLSDDLLADRMDAIDALNSSNFEFQRGEGKGASFFGTGAVGKKFVFVVDCSGSMADEYRWVMARRELKDAITGLTEEQQFYVFLYNDKSFSYTRRTPKLMNASEKNKEKIFKWLDRQRPIGDTRPWRAMKSSLALRPNAVFLLSDGELKDDTVFLLREKNVDRIRKEVKIGKIPIHTISLGSGFGSETMRAISNQNNGTFTHVNTW